MLYLSNAFSLNMLDLTKVQKSLFTPLTVTEAAEIIHRARGDQAMPPAEDFTNAIGHPDTDRVVREVLEKNRPPIDVPGRLSLPLSPGTRATVTLGPSDRLIVAQYKGPRLPEGATSLPVGATIEFVLITFE